MPIKQAGMLASRVSTWPRDHFCRSTIAPRPSRPTTWNEFLPISIPITAITLLSFSDMACSFRWVPPASLLADRGAGARLDHPISGPPVLLRDYAGLIRCLLLCLLRLSQRGQGSRRESLRTLGAWERDAGSTAR